MKKHFKIWLLPDANKIAEMVALEAARYNGRSEEMELTHLWAFATTINQLSNESKNTTIELIPDSNKIHIDTLINGRWETVCIIEAVKVYGIVDRKLTIEAEN